MSSIDTKIDKWKNKLLDMGKRNRLISYRDTKRSSLRFKQPELFEFWDSFVINEIPITFPYIDDDEVLEQTEETINGIITNQTIKEQQRTLRNLRLKAKTAIEEQGVNILYLSFGFLKWYESDSSHQELISPLILVPVSLSVESITSPFVMTLHEDEIVFNPTLKYKLENDFGIKINDFDTEIGLKEYLQQIEEKISTNNWEIISDVGLSLLSFLKINMYNDLDKYKESIKENPIIKALAGDASAINNNIKELANCNFDKTIKPIDVFQVVDADSSQQEAIYNAKNGVSFVLQGPPGTGKSQTITNIIAECIADGKKVLFVSEKMAALDVVYKRLSDVGLNDFCLIMHNYKANKKAILQQLEDVLKLSRQKATLSDEVFQKLDLLQIDKEKLNEYSEGIFKTISPLNKTIYEIDGYIANLDDYKDIIFSIDNVIETTPEKFNRYIYLLNQFVNNVGKMSSDYRKNPWNSSNVIAITNELRHDINANINKLLTKLNNFVELYQKLENDLSIEYDCSYNGLSQLLDILKVSLKSPIIPVNWIRKLDIVSLIDEAKNNEIIKEKYLETQKNIENSFMKIFDNSIEVPDFTNSLVDYENLVNLILKLKERINNNSIYTKWNELNDIELIKEKEKLLEDTIINYNEEKNKLLLDFESDIFQIDYKNIFNRFKTEYNGPLKVFNKQYKEDVKTIKGCYKDIIKKIKDEKIIETLQSLKRISELELWINEEKDNSLNYFGELYRSDNTDFEVIKKEISIYENIKMVIQYSNDNIITAKDLKDKEEDYKEHYEFLYNGLNTDWKIIIDSLEWANSFKNEVTKYNLNSSFINNVCSNKEITEKCSSYISIINDYLDSIKEEYSWFINLFDDKEKINNSNIYKLLDRLESCRDELSKLEEWIDFRTCREDCKKEGLQDYIEKIDELEIKATNIVPMFKKRFYRLWLDAVLPQFPAVINFRRKVQEDTIKEFASLDKLQFEIAKSRIKKKLIDNLPSLDRFTSGKDEISILKRELGKQRKIMPIRKLFREIPNLVLTLKPCLMMSPLSVSIFLDSDSYQFDTVIFDEASQVCTENAIGAIARGKQVIIAGDSKQLPPTNFFTATTSGGDYDVEGEDEYDDEDAYESVLDEAGLLPERTLLWHYRSRNEHLIAFSNAKIYRNNLITFPSNVEKTNDNGVEYIYVQDGIYDRGGKKGNNIEAKKVAELIFEHFKKFPNRSLGVIAFGEIQQQAIETAVRQMRLLNQEFELFFKEDNKEPFFIKNLENVQGDERDTIIFSIGYAKDTSGKMQMLFGPLSQIGGERRLNVAITRAKYNIKLVGSILPTDIEIERITAEGPKLLRSYIDFAMHGIDALIGEITESDIVEHDSPFEEAVYKFLDRKGYKVVTQVGCSGYRIDMAVKHPTLSGTFILGIECDGAAYHSARTARERDRLRQDVLENMGWKIYRIWSTDWIKDSVTEGQRLIQAIEKALSEFTNEEDSFSNTQNKEEKKTEFLEMEAKVIPYEERFNPYHFDKYTFTNISDIQRDYNDNIYFKNVLLTIIKTEYPIHFEFICRKVAYLFGNEKVTVKIRRNVQYMIDTDLKYLVMARDEFYYPNGVFNVIPKINSDRPIEFISKEELAEAMYKIINNCIGVNRESLLQETAKAYGFIHRGNNITNALKNSYEYLLESEKIKEVEGKIIVQ